MAAAVASLLLAASVAGVARASSEPVLGGYDVVAYFGLAEGTPGVKGSAQFTHDLEQLDHTDNSTLGTYTFWFSSDANRAKFADSPYDYAPLFGGF